MSITDDFTTFYNSYVPLNTGHGRIRETHKSSSSVNRDIKNGAQFWTDSGYVINRTFHCSWRTLLKNTCSHVI